MRVLGVDPGIERTGFAVVEMHGSDRELVTYGTIRTSADISFPDRLQVLHTDLSSLLEKYGPFDVAGVEELFFAKNVKTAFVVGQARGVILFTLRNSGLTIVEVKPVEVKAAVVGSGNATKKEVQRMVQILFSLEQPPQPDDAADAVAIAVAAGSHRIYAL